MRLVRLTIGGNRMATHDAFREQLLSVMDRKDHWAWKSFSGGAITIPQLKIHFQQEFAVYVRDFPVFLARVHGKNPPMPVRRALAENLYEEETGGLTRGRAHPEMFLYLMEGLGFTARDFESIELLPDSAAYRRWLDQTTTTGSWIEGAAVATIFVEGSVHERSVFDDTVREEPDIERKIAEHPLVKYHGVAPRYLELARAHGAVEGLHRRDAWKMVLEHANTPEARQRVAHAMGRSLELWLAYRDGVAKACGLTR
jgi:pyrroloquinoline-quinone synthase